MCNPIEALDSSSLSSNPKVLGDCFHKTKMEFEQRLQSLEQEVKDLKLTIDKHGNMITRLLVHTHDTNEKPVIPINTH